MKNENCTDLKSRADDAPAINNAHEAETLDVDVSQLADLPDLLFEAGIHRSLDEIRKTSRSNPLQALDDVVNLMQGLNFELLKAYSPALLAAAQKAGTVALNTQGGLAIGKEHSRALATFCRLQETIAKLGVAQTKTRDEIRKRSARHRKNLSDGTPA